MMATSSSSFVYSFDAISSQQFPEIENDCNNSESKSWAPPQFGKCFATTWLSIAERGSSSSSSSGGGEKMDTQGVKSLQNKSGILVFREKGGKWIKCTEDFIDEHWKVFGGDVMIKDVKFAPASMGLKLAAVYSDGYVRFYSAVDAISYSEWRLEESFPILSKTPEKDPNQLSSLIHLDCRRLCWNNDPASKPLLAIGTSGRVLIYGNSKEEFIHTSWDELCAKDIGETVLEIAWSASMGKSYSFIAAIVLNPEVSPSSAQSKSLRLYKFESGKKEIVEVKVTSPHSLSQDANELFWNSTGSEISVRSKDGKRFSWTEDLFSKEWKIIEPI